MIDVRATCYTVVGGPIGDLLATSDGRALTGLYMEPHKGGPERDERWRRDDASLGPVAEQLSAYFSGQLRRFDLPIALLGTDFQRRVWDALLSVPFGETISYAELARRIGAPRSVRAVGAAVGRNPISIIVPCHRIVGSSGALTGYAGGLDRKRWLLEHEGAVRNHDRRDGRGGRTEPSTSSRPTRAEPRL